MMIQDSVVHAPTAVRRIATRDAERIKRVSVADEQPEGDALVVAREDIEFLANRLELYVALAHIAEACVQLDVRTMRDVRSHTTAVVSMATKACALNIDQVIAANRDALTPVELPADVALLDYRRAVERWCRIAHSVVADFGDVDRTYQLAVTLGAHDCGHRVRCAVERLAAFRRRNTPGVHQVWAAMGRAYANGKVSAELAARVLETDVTTVLQWFETHGFNIGPHLHLLTSDQVDAIADAMLADSVARSGRPVEDPSLARRCTIASQRMYAMSDPHSRRDVALS